MREWIRADFLSLEIEMMPMVKYGMGSWCVLLWVNISSLAPFRYMAHEIFVLQHLASAGVLLWLVHTHVPAYAYYYVWIAIAFVAFDRIARWAWLAYRNVFLFTRLKRRIGYEAELRPAPGNTTRITLKNVPWRWKPGQHIYLWMPRIGPIPIETHPFTLANACPAPENGSAPYDATIAVRTHNGFTARLRRFAAAQRHTTAFVTGPFGAPPDWAAFDTLVLIAASTGASFTLPILEDVLARPRCVRRVAFLLCVRARPHCGCYLARLRAAARDARENLGLLVSLVVWVTGEDADPAEGDVNGGEGGVLCVCGPGREGGCCCGADEERAAALGEKGTGQTCCGSQTQQSCCSPGPQQAEKKSCCDRAPAAEEKPSCCAPAPAAEEKQSCCAPAPAAEEIQSCCGGKEEVTISKKIDDDEYTKITTIARTPSDMSSEVSRLKTEVEWKKGGRPDIEEFIRDPVEAATGETCVAVCGGKSLTGRVRNAVAMLSDERAVHKGTGAQGIMLHVEEFGF